jgi:uncharacterized membrane protein YeaQ/YmgE (transglycosylase-associated protein family)
MPEIKSGNLIQAFVVASLLADGWAPPVGAMRKCRSERSSWAKVNPASTLTRDFDMGLAFLIVAGGILGWFATIARRVDMHGLVTNVVAGITGALLAGLLIGPMVSEGNLLEGRYTVDVLLAALVGAIALLIPVNLVTSDKTN